MKKILLALALIVVAGLGAWLLTGVEINTTNGQMGSGSVVEVGEDYAVIRGYVTSEEGEIELITVNFSVNSRTEFVKSTLKVTQEMRESGKSFTPEISEGEGVFSELAVGMPINGVEAKGELVEGGNARATKIHYSMMEVEIGEIVPEPEEGI